LIGLAIEICLSCRIDVVIDVEPVPENIGDIIALGQLNLRLHVIRMCDDTRNETVAHGILRPDPKIAVGIVDNFLVRLSRLARDDSIDALAHLDDFFGLDGNIGRLTGHPAQGLVQ
jgi:hypothetical protein